MNSFILSPHRVVPLLVILLSVFSTFLANAQTTITKLPFTITKPGNYILRKSMVYNHKSGLPLAAITINVDDVKIDLQGNTISIDRQISKTLETTAIFANERKNITIRNGRILNFFRGIYLEGSGNMGGHTVENIEVADSTFLGIQVKGRGSMIRNNFINVVGRDGGATSYTALRYGIDAMGAGIVVSNNRIVDVILSGGSNSAYGIYVHNADSAIVERNYVLNTTSSVSFTARGIKLHICFGGVVSDNFVTAYPAGLNFTQCNSVIYRDNTVSRSISKYFNEDSTAEDGGGNK